MLVNKIKKIWSLIVILYIIFLALQFTPYNIVDLRFSSNAKNLSILNQWIKENPQEHKKIMDIETKKVDITFNNLAKNTAKKTLNKQFTYTQVKELTKDIKTWRKWNNFRNKFLVGNGTLLFMYLIYTLFVRRKF